MRSRAVDNRFQFRLLGGGDSKFVERLLKIVQECLPLLAGDLQGACESAIDFPVYFCGPPVAQQTISVTKYLKPAGGTRWCASSTRGLAFSLGSAITRSMTVK